MANTLYGRKIILNIACAPEAASSTSTDVITIQQDAFTPEPLRVTFDVTYKSMEYYQWAEITIYNFNDFTMMKAIKEGAAVILSAGYQEGNFGQIFSGFVLQSLVDRENVTDYKVTLRCVDGFKLFDNNLITVTIDKQYTQMTLANAVAMKSQTPIPIGKISDEIPQTKFSRAVTLVGAPAEILRKHLSFNDAKSAQNLQMFFKEGKLYIGKLTDPIEDRVTEISPGQGGLIGSPQQIDYGISFRCLLNPNLILAYPAKKVKLNYSSYQQQKVQMGSNLSMLDYDGEYQIIGVRHIGDTRGSSWYTDVTALTAGGKISLLLQNKEMGGT